MLNQRHWYAVEAMGLLDGGLLGESLVERQGFPQSRAGDRHRTMSRIVGIAVCGAAFASAFAGLAAAYGGTVAPGLVAENPGGIVQDVLPAGAAWRDGVRPGQIVLSLTAADEAEGWAIETLDGAEIIRSDVAAQRRLLEAARPVAIGATGLAALGLLMLRRHRRRADGLATIALVLASIPLSIQGGSGGSAVVLAFAAFLPVGWLVQVLPKRALSAAVTGAGIALPALWLTLRLLEHPAVAPFEEVRNATAVAGGMLVAGTLVGGLPRVKVPNLGRPHLLDLASVAALIVLVLALLMASTPPLVLAIAVAMAVAGYPAFRRGALRVVDRFLFAEMRERLTIQATETERAKLARELHDAPLQELAGVIKRLERVPQAQGEGDALRGIAQQLRDVTVQLHPPVLEDLGLVPALEFLVSQPPYRAAGAEVAVEVCDRTTLHRSDRPPPDVELAIFRIAQEALGNAIRHSGALRIKIEGEVDGSRVVLAIADDGCGLDRAAEQRAVREGRLGLSSMQRRAESIGANLRLRSKPGRGTQVRVEWEA